MEAIQEETIEGSQMLEFVNAMYDVARSEERASGVAFRYGDVISGFELMITANEYFRAIRVLHGGDE